MYFQNTNINEYNAQYNYSETNNSGFDLNYSPCNYFNNYWTSTYKKHKNDENCFWTEKEPNNIETNSIELHELKKEFDNRYVESSLSSGKVQNTNGNYEITYKNIVNKTDQYDNTSNENRTMYEPNNLSIYKSANKFIGLEDNSNKLKDYFYLQSDDEKQQFDYNRPSNVMNYKDDLFLSYNLSCPEHAETLENNIRSEGNESTSKNGSCPNFSNKNYSLDKFDNSTNNCSPNNHLNISELSKYGNICANKGNRYLNEIENEKNVSTYNENFTSEFSNNLNDEAVTIYDGEIMNKYANAKYNKIDNNKICKLDLKANNCNVNDIGKDCNSNIYINDNICSRKNQEIINDNSYTNINNTQKEIYGVSNTNNTKKRKRVKQIQAETTLNKFTLQDENGKKRIRKDIIAIAENLPSLPGLYFDKKQKGFRVRYQNVYVGWVALSRFDSIEEAYCSARVIWENAKASAEKFHTPQAAVIASLPLQKFYGKNRGGRPRTATQLPLLNPTLLNTVYSYKILANNINSDYYLNMNNQNNLPYNKQLETTKKIKKPIANPHISNLSTPTSCGTYNVKNNNNLMLHSVNNDIKNDYLDENMHPDLYELSNRTNENTMNNDDNNKIDQSFYDINKIESFDSPIHNAINMQNNLNITSAWDGNWISQWITK